MSHVFFPTCFRVHLFRINKQQIVHLGRGVWLKGPQLLSHMIMTINVYFTYYCGYRTHLNKSFLCHFKPQKPLEMTIKAHSAVLNVHFYHHLHLPTSFLGYRTQFKLIKFNSVLIVPNSLKKRHFKPQKPLEMAMKPHSAVLNVKFYYYS